MASVAQSDDSRFDEAEADVERGEPWAFREDGAVDPLTLLATGWSRGHTQHGEAEFLNGVDRDGKAWSVLVGNVVLTKRLIEGLVEEWSDEHGKFVVTETLGRVEPGEVVSLKYLGEGESSNGKAYPRFTVSRKPASAARADDKPETPAEPGAGGGGDDIPFQ